MVFSDKSYNLRIELDTKHCQLSAGELEQMEGDLDALSRVVRDFPVSDLYITVIHHARSNDFHVKTALRLPKRTLFTGDRDAAVHPAYERCVRKLVRKVEALKAEMRNASEISKQQKGTHQHVVPTRQPEFDAVRQAVDDGDYLAFRNALDVYEEPIRKRVGRWIQRYPDVQAEIGEHLSIDDIVEEVFLNAFDQFEWRPQSLAFADWLENLVDPSIHDLLKRPEEEMENINFIRSMRPAE